MRIFEVREGHNWLQLIGKEYLRQGDWFRISDEGKLFRDGAMFHALSDPYHDGENWLIRIEATEELRLNRF